MQEFFRQYLFVSVFQENVSFQTSTGGFQINFKDVSRSSANRLHFRDQTIIENFFLKPSYTLLDVHGGTKISIDFFFKIENSPET